MKGCAVLGCPRSAEGFVCLHHWSRIPAQLQQQIRAAARDHKSAAALADSFPTRRSARMVADARHTAYVQLKNRVVQQLETQDPVNV